MHNLFRNIAERIISPTSQFNGISIQEAERLTEFSDSSLIDIMALARLSLSFGKEKKIGAGCNEFTCGIISAKTGRCSENCSFCAQSAHYNTCAVTHPLISYDDLARRADELSSNGVKRFGIVTSGHTLSTKEYDVLCENISRLKNNFPIQICASLGRLSEMQGRMLKDAGVTRYHHNLETSRSFYPQICTTHSYEDRVATVEMALKVGLECCSGGIFGLGESWSDRFEMASTLNDLNTTCIPVNFLSPIKGTPMEHKEPPRAKEALLVIALLRLLMPNKGIVVCGGRGLCLKELQGHIFGAGANGVMVGNYLVTHGCSLEKDRLMLQDLGLSQALNTYE